MFKISEFSMLSKIPLKTLRYYDQIGVLKPDKVDQDTRYRYYSAEQLLKVNRILIYKELGFTLQQISPLLEEEISPEQIRGMLKLKVGEIQQLIETEQIKLNRIKERMKLIEAEGCVEKEQEVIIKAIETQEIVSINSTGSTEDIPNMFHTLDQLIEKRNLPMIKIPKIVLWKESNGKDGEFDLEVGYSIKRDRNTISEELNIRSLPAESSMATLLFRSDSDIACTACVDLALWIQQNGYKIKKDQPGREVHLPMSGNENIKLIEIQIPIEDEGCINEK
ncbi:MerR family transcriptional regulator [Bacillus sp. JCM 19034]|uniref:MerR family transcriptional regulator n=1 Tax=Bacillus sp. JCM 19034 TaxID=1481928 RepID=UPI000782BAEC|nr:MerR family transcriptional regulator [Bacillus sp. JCM 19034]